MSIVNVRAALEIKLATVSPPIDTVAENVKYTPTPGTPYQEVYLLPAEPENTEFGPMYQEHGIFQINLQYPLDGGAGDAAARAELIRAAFKRGTSLTQGGDIIVIERTPEVGPGMPGDATYQLPVRVRWFSNVNS